MLQQPFPDRPSAEDILAAVPGLAPYARPAVVLEPVPGTPGVHESSIGGPLLWPADEPWPRCSVPDETSGEEEPEPSAMVPVVQVFRADAPGGWWPDGADVFQLLWCPNMHWDPPVPQPEANPVIEIRWRRAADVTSVRAEPPVPLRTGDELDGFVPRPCTLTPFACTDFASTWELPEELVPDVRRLMEAGREAGGERLVPVTSLGGYKFGGWPYWGITDPCEYRCDVCDAVMPLLFTVASDDRTGIVVGRFGALRVFACPRDVGHGYWFDVQ
ncbi:hypothetical protein ACFYU9_10440 [Streptomyces sp. NPDC004327]|uniref:hypothetical protein n=1 Tax=Streptomyces sp. NPDC004327 TaxID=3364699 RepID=UPI0036AC7DD4